MVHNRKRLSLCLEARDHFSGVHSRPNNLQGHTTSDRPLLLGQEHNTKSSFPDLLRELVGAYHGAGAFGNWLVYGWGGPRFISAVQKTVLTFMSLQ
jgi:hypothetical protein